MNSYQLINQIDGLLASIDEQAHFLATLNILADHHDKLPTAAVSAARKAQIPNDAQHYESLNKARDFLMQQIQSIEPRKVFKSIDALENAFISFSLIDNHRLQEAPRAISIVGKELQNFSSNYNNYLATLDQTIRESAIIPLTHTATVLYASLSMIKAMFSDIKNRLQEHKPVDGLDLERFSLYIESEIDLEKFAQNLYSINLIYGELCSLLNISPSDYPLIILKIESGSSWIDLLGYPQIIKLLVSLIQGAIDYFYRSFTREGKIVSLPRKVQAVEDVIELRKKLVAMGINTSAIDDQLSKSTYVIAEELNKLLVGEPRISLNGQTFSIGGAFEKRYLELGRKALLPKLDEQIPSDE
jgi:hypothetical protein